MEHPVPDFHGELGYRNAKSPASIKAGLSYLRLKKEPWFLEPRLYLLFDAFFLTRTGIHFARKRYD
jgi:hypothetical protein